MGVTVRAARDSDDLRQFGKLLVEYNENLPPDLQHDLAPALRDLAAYYADPSAAFVALADGEPAGCVVMEHVDDGSAVIKRLYTRDAFRGRGVARALMAALIERARELGCRRVVLDTDREQLVAAYKLYQSLGFVECEPYGEVDYRHATFMELRLDGDDSLRSRFERDGFLVVPGFVSAEAIAALRTRAAEIVDAFDPSVAAGIFTTRDESSTKSDEYFLTSGTTIRCFFEEEAFDASDALRQAKELSINKIGHAMHDLDPVFERFSHGSRFDGLVRGLGLAEPLIYQSMYIFKQPHIGGEVRWHQDATYFETEPSTVTTLWFALEHADRSNGCLWVQRGGHRTPLRERFVVDAAGSRLERLDDTPWPSDAEAEPLEVEAGTLVVFHGLLPHYSAPNRSATSRHAYTLHAVDGRARYSPKNWLQRDAAFPPRGFV
ncbi:MAG: GNAT family N-acetyltransferase [Candidatus Eremiobacteraeota bacterium]|nr:GNAT family N-acetyltransferase [Candidatus Eremiobacteraeota bacterium]